jgi:hypothetical protein
VHSHDGVVFKFSDFRRRESFDVLEAGVIS